MLYVVGDSNAVYTSGFLLSAPAVEARTLCRVGWTTADVLAAIRRAGDLSDASAFFVFVGLNDRLTGEALASNILQIVAALRARRASPRVRLFVAPPFCVDGATSQAVCADRRDAAARVVRELDGGAGGLGSVLVAPHVTRGMFAKKALRAYKPASTRVDPLHLNATGYMRVADEVNRALRAAPHAPKRATKPRVRYEAGPAPSPRDAWAAARRRD